MEKFEDIVIETYKFQENYSYVLEYFKTSDEDQQKLLLKKLFYEKRIGNIELNSKTLSLIESYSNDQNIKSICFILKSLLRNIQITKLNNILADYICQSISENIDGLKLVSLCFNKCYERLGRVSKKPAEWYIEVNCKNYLLRRKSLFNGSFYEEVLGIYVRREFYEFYSDEQTCTKETINNVVHYFDDIEIDGNKFRAEYKKDNSNYLITPIYSNLFFCEGKQVEKKCDTTNKSFSWCRNSQCYAPNQQPAIHFTDYTLLDFINTLQIPINEEHYYLNVPYVQKY